ncbi:C5a anaphylatoxin chemotactic receptor 2 isoform X2 [Hyaena hyaena]|uniref:C5a anaphylatoxin chemotactic receptor 2 isoform X2 n=1 Tax=Hyaena hyaena TaxID=95912 RepID=UPI00192317AB|nr:C5a anaphylatoxin chemotactic receptor 2 isoform X2 [Hyaena hyaena]
MRTLLQETVSGAWMENATLSYEYGDYAGVPDLPVDCVDAPCGSTHPLSTAPFLLYAAVFLVGVPGNAVVAWVAGREARRRAGATWFLHLAVADLLCCLSLPLLAVPLALGGHWPFGALGCRALSSAILLSMYAGVLLLAALSVDLCLGALRPGWGAAAGRARGVRVACGGAWAVAVLLTAPSAFYRRLHQEHFPRRLQCVLDYGGSAAVENTVTATRFIFGFLGPLVVVAACHGALLCRAARHRWLLGTAVVVGFFVCWAPYHALGLVITVAAPHSRLLARALRAEPLVTGLALAHSCLNPMLFLYFGRTQLRRSLPAACRWALKESQSKDASVASKKSTSHDLVSEAEV